MLSSASGTMSNNTNYSNDRNAETEYAVDPASGGIFHADFKRYVRMSPGERPNLKNRSAISRSRHDDLKEMLDSNKDSLKLEAMKRIIGVRSRS